MTNPYYTYSSGQPVALSRAASSAIRTEFGTIQAGFDAVSTALLAKGSVGGQNWTGVHDFSGGAVKIRQPVDGGDPVSLAYVQNLIIGGIVPTASGDAGKFLGSDGTTATFRSIDGRGAPLVALGNSGATAQNLAYSSSAEGWTLAVTGVFNLTASGFPAGRISGGLLNLSNGGAFAWTSTGITWIKADGSKTASLTATGYVLATSGTNQLALFTFGDGVVFGKLVA